jgi:hypothetical protein
VLAQVQTMRNEINAPPSDPSSPWLTASAQSINSTKVNLALERAEVNDGASVSQEEVIGYLAISQGATSFVDDGGNTILWDALISPDVITGWDDAGGNGNGVAINFSQAFSSAPLVVANHAKRDGGDGGWMRQGATSASSVRLTCDEDQFTDSERGHTSEAASILAFSDAFRYTAAPVYAAPAAPSLRYIAAEDTTNNTTWENTTSIGGYDWSINANTRAPIGGPLTQAYVFPGARGTMTHLEGMTGDATNDSASFEILFRASDATGQEILFEFGGTGYGTALAIDGDQVLFTTSSNSPATTKQLAVGGLTTNYIHAVGVIDLIGSAGSTLDPDLFLFINGHLAVADLDVAGFLDWAGTDGSGVGTVNGSAGGNHTGLLNGFGNFSGQIVALNFYEDPLSPAQIAALYESWRIPEPSTLALLGAGLLVASRRRRNV